MPTKQVKISVLDENWSAQSDTLAQTGNILVQNGVKIALLIEEFDKAKRLISYKISLLK